MPQEHNLHPDGSGLDRSTAGSPLVYIETCLERVWPLPAQETLAYAPPIADDNCLYLRGERYLYCIGERGNWQGAEKSWSKTALPAERL